MWSNQHRLNGVDLGSWGYKVIYSNSARIRLHYYFLNLHLQYAVLSIIIYFTFTFTLYR